MSAELLIELQCEELPPSMIRPALKALEKGVLGLLSGIEHGESTCYATPRRLAVHVATVAPGKPVVEKLVTGPPVERAYKDLPGGDLPIAEQVAQATPTGAAIGFARGKGVDVAELDFVSTKKGYVIAARTTEGGEQTVEILAAGLDGLVRDLPFRKSMQWGSGGMRFGRPLHRVSAVYGGAIVAAEAAGLTVGNTTVGHRLAANTSFAFDGLESWLSGLRTRKVEPDMTVREAEIRRLLAEATETLGADPIEDDILLEEVLHLVEWPCLVIGTFDEDFLTLPPRLLVASMKKNQRYFPVYEDGALTSRFVVISNNPWGDHDTIAEGNARVLRPRFHDAKFFLDEDEKTPLTDGLPGLQKMRWIRGLGSMADKSTRIGTLAQRLSAWTGADPEAAKTAGGLCKADLVSLMVQEFPKLQGHMGRLYAQHDGHSDSVSLAIEEHYLPRNADDVLPQTPAGVATALADRLDTLSGCFGIDLKPRGGDPQGLRRAALGVVRILAENAIDVALPELFGLAVDTLHADAVENDQMEKWRKIRATGAAAADRDTLCAELVDFTVARFRAMKTGSGLSGDLVDAVLAVSPPNPLVLDRKCEAMRHVAQMDGFLPMMHTFKRVLNITAGKDFPAPTPDQFTEDTERALAEVLSSVESAAVGAMEERDYTRALNEIVRLAEPVSAFFEAVFVEDPDPAIRAVRLGLLLRISRLFLQVADFSRVSTR